MQVLKIVANRFDFFTKTTSVEFYTTYAIIEKKKNLYALDHTIILISRAGVGKTCSCVETMMIHFLK